MDVQEVLIKKSREKKDKWFSSNFFFLDASI